MRLCAFTPKLARKTNHVEQFNCTLRQRVSRLVKEHVVKSRTRRRPLPAPHPPAAERPLSPTRAFVVQFREETDGAQNYFTGRVEHLVSGYATRFHSPEGLLAFFAQVLNTTYAKPP